MASSPSYLPPTAAEAALQHAVGSAVVGYGSRFQCLHGAKLGILPDVNIVYRVQELGVYDPIVPNAYFQSWKRFGNGKLLGGIWWWYCPPITTAAVARRYGVSFVLEAAGAPGPQGGVFDTKLGGEELYRIPGAALATVSLLAANGALPSLDAPATPVAVIQPNPASWKLETHTKGPSVLRLRLTDVPGWHATIDGKPLALHRFGGVMLQARIPAGHHTIELNYLPTAFVIGLVLAGCSFTGLCIASILGVTRRHRRMKRTPSDTGRVQS